MILITPSRAKIVSCCFGVSALSRHLRASLQLSHRRFRIYIKIAGSRAISFAPYRAYESNSGSFVRSQMRRVSWPVRPRPRLKIAVKIAVIRFERADKKRKKTTSERLEGRSGCLRSTEIPPRTLLTEKLRFNVSTLEHACDVTQYYITMAPFSLAIAI